MDEPMTQRFAAIGDDSVLVACAGYRNWAEVIGQQCVLTHPAHRRRGLARAVAHASTAAAIRAGLVAQWRSDVSNTASKLLGEGLGYEVLGRQTTVQLPPTVGR
jgi:predicted GNAT family acetyltransferase